MNTLKLLLESELSFLKDDIGLIAFIFYVLISFNLD